MYTSSSLIMAQTNDPQIDPIISQYRGARIQPKEKTEGSFLGRWVSQPLVGVSP